MTDHSPSNPSPLRRQLLYPIDFARNRRLVSGLSAARQSFVWRSSSTADPNTSDMLWATAAPHSRTGWIGRLMSHSRSRAGGQEAVFFRLEDSFSPLPVA